MNIEELTIRDAREIARLFSSDIQPSDSSHWKIGKNYFIRTVTHHHTGKLVRVTPQELVLENAAWIASDGRFTSALSQGVFDEVEMFPPSSQVIIGIGSLIDAVEIVNTPTSQK